MTYRDNLNFSGKKSALKGKDRDKIRRIPVKPRPLSKRTLRPAFFQSSPDFTKKRLLKVSPATMPGKTVFKEKPIR